MTTEQSPLIPKQLSAQNYISEKVGFGGSLVLSGAGTAYEVFCIVTKSPLPSGGPIALGACAFAALISVFGLIRASTHSNAAPLTDVVVVDTNKTDSDSITEIAEIARAVEKLVRSLNLVVSPIETNETPMERTLRLLKMIPQEGPRLQIQGTTSIEMGSTDTAARIQQLETDLEAAHEIIEEFRNDFELNKAGMVFYKNQLARLEILLNESSSNGTDPKAAKIMEEARTIITTLKAKSAASSQAVSPMSKKGSPATKQTTN